VGDEDADERRMGEERLIGVGERERAGRKRDGGDASKLDFL
jgi:hypothetical protein